MKKFIVIYHTPPEVIANRPEPTPEQWEEGMKPWMEWAARTGEGLLDMGTPLGGGESVDTNGNHTPLKSSTSGYSFLQAESLDAAKAMLESHPHLGWNPDCSIEIFEAMPM